MNKLAKSSSASLETRTTASDKQGLAGPHFRLVAARRRGALPTNPPIVTTTGLYKSYRKGQVSIPVLNGVDFQVADGEFVAIVGKSGSGKSTLLHLLATLDAPSAGEIHFAGRRIDDVPAVKRDALRNDDIGVIFQFYHLLPELTTLENVVLPTMIGDSIYSYWRKRRKIQCRAISLLEQVELGHRLRHRPRELSGGEMQRVAIARSLMSQPRILLADEPTGNLDRQTGVQIMELMRSLNVTQKLTIVMVTHDATLAEQADRVVQLVEGRVRHA